MKERERPGEKSFEERISKQGREDFFDYFFYRKFSPYFTRILVKTPITGNGVTTFSLVLALVAALFFAFGYHKYLVVGAILLLLSQILDASDGEVARYRGESSEFGCWYDESTDVIKFFATFAGLTYGEYSLHPRPLVLVFGGWAIINILLFNYLRQIGLHRIAKDAPSEMPFGKKWFFGPTAFTDVVTVVFTLINQAYLLLILYATLGNLIWLKKFHSSYKLGSRLKTRPHRWEEEHK